MSSAQPTGPTPRHVRARRRERAIRLRQLGYETYPSYLRSSHWQRLKAAYRASEHQQDCMCGETEVDLHHTTYERIGEELLTDLVPLCRRCHSALHVLEYRGDTTLDPADLVDEERAAANAVIKDEREQQLDEEAQALRRQRLDEFRALPIAERVEYVQIRAKSLRVDISGPLMIVQRQLERAYKRTDLPQHPPHDITILRRG